ncbi:MAG: RNA polymerase sigma factor [Polyangiaceae bacterium]
MQATEAQQMGQGLTDEDLRERVLGGDSRYFEVLMRRHNQRLFRAARAILKSDDEAEDVMQEAYARAYAHLATFAGQSRFSTWLTRIAVHEALSRLRRRRHEGHDGDADGDPLAAAPSPEADPEVRAHGGQLRGMLARAVDALPEGFREVFVLRAVEELSVAETAECLDIPEEMVKTRLFRARARLQQQLASELDGGVAEVFAFHLVRCDRVVEGAFARIRAAAAPAATAAAG